MRASELFERDRRRFPPSARQYILIDIPNPETLDERLSHEVFQEYFGFPPWSHVHVHIYHVLELLEKAIQRGRIDERDD